LEDSQHAEATAIVAIIGVNPAWAMAAWRV